MKAVQRFRVREHVRTDGSNPFREWLIHLDRQAAARVQARILRVEMGNLGDYNSIGDGVFKLRVNAGPGYRVYFGFEGNRVILLLVRGDKRTQRRDIATAKRYWKERDDHGTT